MEISDINKVNSLLSDQYTYINQILLYHGVQGMGSRRSFPLGKVKVQIHMRYGA